MQAEQARVIEGGELATHVDAGPAGRVGFAFADDLAGDGGVTLAEDEVAE